jgi:hypothetical protein
VRVLLGPAVDDAGGGVAPARGEFEAGYRASIEAFRLAHGPEIGALPRAARAAAWLGDVGAVREARQLMDPFPGSLPAVWRLEVDGAIAALEGRRGDAISIFLDAFRKMRDLGLEYERAVAAVFIAKLLGADTPELREAIEESEATLRRLGATPSSSARRGALPAGVRMPVPDHPRRRWRQRHCPVGSAGLNRPAPVRRQTVGPVSTRIGQYNGRRGCLVRRAAQRTPMGPGSLDLRDTLGPVATLRDNRAVATVLFADVTGSTVLGEQLDPDDDDHGPLLAKMKAVIERHGGTVEVHRRRRHGGLGSPP